MTSTLQLLGSVLAVCLLGIALAAIVLVRGPIVPGAVTFAAFAAGAALAALEIARRLNEPT